MNLDIRSMKMPPPPTPGGPSPMGSRDSMEMPEFISPPTMPPVQVRVYTESKHELPEYETSGASGMDLRSNMDVVIGPGETTIVKTGLFVEIPNGLEIQVRPRSGMSFKTKMRVANSPGTIDSCYRGEIGVICENIGTTPIEIKDGDRIAQAVLVPVLRISWQKVETKEALSSTDRGEGGFGSTGK